MKILELKDNQLALMKSNEDIALYFPHEDDPTRYYNSGEQFDPKTLKYGVRVHTLGKGKYAIEEDETIVKSEEMEE